MKRIKIICAKCGSDDVRRDALARWDMDTQNWVLTAVLDEGSCEVCGEEDLKEVEVEEDDTRGSDQGQAEPPTETL